MTVRILASKSRQNKPDFQIIPWKIQEGSQRNYLSISNSKIQYLKKLDACRAQGHMGYDFPSKKAEWSGALQILQSH